MPESDLSQSLSESRDPRPSAKFNQPTLRRVTPPADGVDSDDEELAVRLTLEEKFKHISLDPGKQHFIGKSSNLMFIQTAVEFQEGSSTERKSDSSRSQTPVTKLPFFDSATVRPSCLCMFMTLIDCTSGYPGDPRNNFTSLSLMTTSCNRCLTLSS